MDSLVDDLRQLIEEAVEQRGHERVLLCGESFGGALSLSFALAYPQLLLGLVIINSFPVVRRRLRLSLAPRLLRVIPWAAMPLVRRFTESRLHSPHTLAVDLAEFHERTRSIGRDGYIRRLEILQTYDVRNQLDRIRTPALLLAGDLDHLVPSVNEARFMASRMPDATVKILRGYGHVCLINHDFNLLDHIAPWLDGLK
jgi:pimeloyl-ACP methyl ester carboxylesterase